MDNNVWKPVSALLGIGAAVALAKGLKSKKPAKEVIAEMIITSIFALGAYSILVVWPEVPVMAVIGVGAVLASLGVAFFSAKIELAIDKAIERFISKKGD